MDHDFLLEQIPSPSLSFCFSHQEGCPSMSLHFCRATDRTATFEAPLMVGRKRSGFVCWCLCPASLFAKLKPYVSLPCMVGCQNYGLSLSLSLHLFGYPKYSGLHQNGDPKGDHTFHNPHETQNCIMRRAAGVHRALNWHTHRSLPARPRWISKVRG